MPIYEFKCENCSIVFEQFVTSSTQFLGSVKCPKCGADKVKKQMSSFSSGSSFSSSFGSGAGASSSPVPGGCGTGRFS